MPIKMKLKEIANVEMGQSPDSNYVFEYDDLGMPFLQGNADFGNVNPLPQFYCSKPLKKAQYGDILISVRAPVGAVNIADQAYCIGRGLAAIRLKNNDISSSLFLNIISANKQNLIRVAQGSTFEAISKNDLLEMDIYVPESDLLKKIDNSLHVIEQTINQTRIIIEKLNNKKEGLLNDLLTRGVGSHENLRPSYEDAPYLYQETELGFIPKEWGIVKLEDIAHVSRGKFTHRPRNDPAFFNGAYPFIQTGDVSRAKGGIVETYSQTLSYKGIKVSQEFPKGTIAVTIAANIADTAILGRAMYFPDSVVGVVPFDMSVSRFIELCIRSNKKSLDAKAPQSAQKNINLQDLRPLLIVNPPKEEQLNIINTYEALENRLNNESHLLNKLLMQKVGLLKDLLQN